MPRATALIESWISALVSTAVLAVAVAVPVHAESRHAGIQWRPWSESSLEDARNQSKLVLLDLTSPWCAFCEQMKTVTYRDRDVAAVVREHYIPVRIDDQLHPKTASRFAAYGRPATVVLDADGTELIRRRGYLEPHLMTWMLQAVAQDPNPESHR